jgi:peptide/nickel transport system substrate-binding protein
LEIRLNSPCSSFLEILSEPIFTVRKLNNDLKDWLKNYKNIVYSGPFKIDDIAENKEITLVKNKFYWDTDHVPGDKIFITALEGSEISLAAFQTGKINVFSNPPMSEINGLIADNEAEVIPINSGGSLIYNLKRKGIVSNLNFRKAVNSVIDRQELVDNNLNGVSRSAAAFTPFDTEDSKQSFERKSLFKDFADIDAGKKLLEDSQYDKKEKIKLAYLNDDKNKRLCEAFAKNIKDTLEINIENIGYSEAELKEIIKNDEFDILQIDYTSFYDDPISFLEQWTSTSKGNIGGYRNIAFDNMILKAKLEKDQTKRDEILLKAEELLVSDMPVVPISFYNIILCKRPKIQNIYVTRQGNIKLDRAYINNN